ncbi:MAG: amidohydrolase family protein [Aquisalinus sp.]|nr:amidohydrolase family protein [Aquisalinus sp.]
MKRAISALAVLLAGCQPAPVEPDGTIIYPAQLIRTLTGEADTAEAIAVKDGLITGIGTEKELLAQFPSGIIDQRYADDIIVPGLIDPHMHVLLGSVLYSLPFATPWPMAGPSEDLPGFPTRAEFMARLSEIVQSAEDDGSPVFIYGYHNLVQGNLTRDDLDAISSERPIFVWHYSGHDFYLNSPALALAEITPALHDTYEGIGLNEDGTLNGRVYEDALSHFFERIGRYLFNPVKITQGAESYFSIMRAAGITTTAELAYGGFDRTLENAIIASSWSLEDDGFRLFLIPEFRAMEREFSDDPASAVSKMVSGEIMTPAPVLPRIKFFTDGAFYSQTMRLSPPGYISGQSAGTEGLWVLQPEEIADRISPYWDIGLSVHIHSNGDAAQTASLSALETLRSKAPDRDFVIEHGGLFSPAQVERVAEIGAMVSAASHYVYFMSGDYQKPLGLERASWISPLGSLSDNGVTVTIHSDAPLAPPQPLKAAGRHITRATREGTIYQPGEALTPYEALEAITLDAARVLGLSDQIGSLEVGKAADFTILGQDPLTVDGNVWADIPIIASMVDGKEQFKSSSK